MEGKLGGVLFISALLFLVSMLVVEGVGSDVLIVGNGSGMQGDQVVIPVLISSSSPVSAFNVGVVYDPEVLQAGVVGVNGVKYLDREGALTEGYEMIVVNNDVPGEILIGGASLTPGVGEGVFLNLLFTIKPGASKYGPSVIGLSLLQDSGNHLASFTVVPGYVDLVNVPPVVGAVPPQEVYIGNVLSFVVDASDVNNDKLIFSLASNSPPGSSINSDGVFSWTALSEGSYNFNILVSDGFSPYVVIPVDVISVVNPAVVSTEPANNEVDVLRTKPIRVTFCKDVMPGSVNSNTIVVKDNLGSRVSGFVSYSDKVATFKPVKPLKPDTMYTAVVSRSVKDLLGNPMDEDHSWSFTTEGADLVPPSIIETSPVSNAVGVSLISLVTVNFSEPLNPLTVKSNSFVLKDGSGFTVPSVVSYKDGVVTLKPSKPLKPGTVYTAAVTKAVKDLFGNSLAADYSWSFTTLSSDIVDLAVVSTSPSDGSINLPLNSLVVASFNEPIDKLTVKSNSFMMQFVLRDNEGVGVPGTVSVDSSLLRATFKPARPLKPGTVYTATVTKAVKDLFGNSLASDYSWSFTTQIPDLTPPRITETSPIAGSFDTGLNSVVVARFSEDLKSLSVKSNSFILKNDRGARVSGLVSYSNGVAMFKPLKPLKDNVVYTATVTKAVKDLAGNGLASDYSWSFST